MSSAEPRSRRRRWRPGKPGADTETRRSRNRQQEERAGKMEMKRGTGRARQTELDRGTDLRVAGAHF